MQNETDILKQEEQGEKEAHRLRQVEVYTAVVVGCIMLAVFVVYPVVRDMFIDYTYRGDFRYRVIANDTEISIRRVQLESRRTFGTELYIPSHIKDLPITTIRRHAFYNGGVPANRRTSVNWRLTYVHIPYGIRDIGRYAFAHNSLVEIAIPNSVTHINRRAFTNNLLTELTIPDSVIYIGMGAFTNNPLTYVSIPSHTSVHRGAFDSNVTVVRRD